jgi:hypothetical protein
MLDELSSDQAASLRAVIVQEQATVKRYNAELRTLAPGAIKRQMRARLVYHKAQIKRRKEELKHA